MHQNLNTHPVGKSLSVQNSHTETFINSVGLLLYERHVVGMFTSLYIKVALQVSDISDESAATLITIWWLQKLCRLCQ